jgi:hypothetical protein
LIDCVHKYTILKENYINILNNSVIKIDPASHEQIHINIYDLNKILKKINKFIEIIDDENFDKEKKDNIIRQLSEDFFDKIEQSYSALNVEILNFKNMFNTN